MAGFPADETEKEKKNQNLLCPRIEGNHRATVEISRGNVL